MILVSAGHHPFAKGAEFDGFVEFDEAQVWQSLIANRLGRHGLVVPCGVLRDKVRYINDCARAMLAVEIHFNSAVDEDGNRVGYGSETLYYPGSRAGLSIATAVQECLSGIFPPNRGAKEGWYRMNRRFGPNFFLAKTRPTAIIIEPEFVHHKQIIVERREAACDAIAKALLEVV